MGRAQIYVNIISPLLSSSSGWDRVGKLFLVLVACLLYGGLAVYLMLLPVKKRVALPDGLADDEACKGVCASAEALDAPFLTHA